MAVDIAEIDQLAKAQHEQYRNFSNSRKLWVGLPLYYSTYFFKKLFSMVIGLEFLIDRWKGQKISDATFFPTLPSITYSMDEKDNKMDYAIGRPGGREISAGFYRVDTTYTIHSYFAYPVVAWNYIIRNVGKMVGCSLAAIWSFPVHCILKTIENGINAYNDFLIKHKLQTMSKQDLIDAYSNGELLNVPALTLINFFSVSDLTMNQTTFTKAFTKALTQEVELKFSTYSYLSFCAIGALLGTGVATLILFGMHDFSSWEGITPESNVATKASVFFGGCALLSASLSYGYKRMNEDDVTAQLGNKM